MAPKPKTKAKRKPPPKPKLTLAQQQAAEAARIADLAITPGKIEIANAIKEAEDRRILAARAAEGIGRVLSDMTKGDAEALRAAYADSASRLGSYGSALTGPVRSAIDSAASQARAGIANLGLPGDVKSGSGDVVNTALMYSVRPTSDSLLAAAPRALEANQMRRSAAGLRLADSASAIDWKAIEGIEGLRGEIQKLEAKRPGLILDALGDIRQQANAERATNTQIGYLQLSQAKSLEDQAIAKTNISGQLHIVVGKGKNARVVNTGRMAPGSDAVVSAVRAETSRENARIAAEQRAAAARTAADARRDAAQIAANAKTEAARIAAAKKTTTQQVSQAKNANSAQTAWVKNATAYARSIVGVSDKTGRPRRMPPARTSVMRAIVNTWGPTIIGKFGITRADVEKWASAIVMAMPNAWWQKGNYGAATSGASSGQGGSYTAGG